MGFVWMIQDAENEVGINMPLQDSSPEPNLIFLRSAMCCEY